MNLFDISVLFSVSILLMNFKSIACENCSWTECLLSNSSFGGPSTEHYFDCPNKEEAVLMKTCPINKDYGYTLCCSHRTTNGENDSDQKSRFMWWPNDFGVLVRVSILCPFPESVAKNDSVKFYLYTRNSTNVTDRNELFIDDFESLENSGFIRDFPVKMIIHGFMSNSQQGPAKVLRENYLRLPYPVNIIAVDWRKLANYAQGIGLANPFLYLCYGAAAESTSLVGKRSALMLEFLIKQNYTTLENIHVLGHSLGAHCAGYTGKQFSMGRILRITGLDPAGPSFRDVGGDKRIDYTDAEFVDVIHTSTTGGKLSFGLRDQVGHADFYPNGGTSQPGCAAFPPSIFPPLFCSHGRSYEFYGESIQPLVSKVFTATLCKSIEEAESEKCTGPETTLMGACTKLDNSSRSIYYVKTNSESPYALDEQKSSDPTFCLLN